jgi:hypothetical protein
MTYVTDASYDRRPNWFRRSEAWLDDKGKGAWIAAMVLGFIFFWPVGLALLAYMIWSKRMFNGSCADDRAPPRPHAFRPRATPPSTPTRRRRCAGSRKSRTPSRPSCSGCAKPRTRPSSTSSWTTARSAPVTRRTNRPRPEARRPRPPAAPLSPRGGRALPSFRPEMTMTMPRHALGPARPRAFAGILRRRAAQAVPRLGGGLRLRPMRHTLPIAPQFYVTARSPARTCRADGAEAVHRAAGRTCAEAERRAVEAGLPPQPERPLPPLLRRMFGLPLGPHPGGGLRALAHAEAAHPPQRASAAQRDLPWATEDQLRCSAAISTAATPMAAWPTWTSSNSPR